MSEAELRALYRELLIEQIDHDRQYYPDEDYDEDR